MQRTRTIRGQKMKRNEEEDSEPETTPYEEREREDGEGAHRINTPFTFGENMYGLCFIAQVKSIYK